MICHRLFQSTRNSGCYSNKEKTKKDALEFRLTKLNLLRDNAQVFFTTEKNKYVI